MSTNGEKAGEVKITYTYVGTLEYRGRLLKQIATAQAAGFDCKVIYGDKGQCPFKREDYDFPIDLIETPMMFKGTLGGLVLFLQQIRFGFVASRRIVKSDATHVVSFSLESLLAGVLAKRKRPDLKLIFDSNELHIESYVSKVKKFLWAPIQKFCVKYCDVIMHAEGNRLKHFKEHHDRTGREHFLLENFPKFIEKKDVASKPQAPPLRVLYVGSMGFDRYTRELVDIFRELGPDIALDLVGPAPAGFKEELQRELDANPAPNVRVLPSIPYAKMGETIQQYHVGIALYKNTNLCNYYCAPNKVFDYLMNGASVIANNYPGLVKVLEAGKLGACVEDVNIESFRAALNRIVEERLWENITEDVRHQFSWEAQVPSYLGLFR